MTDKHFIFQRIQNFAGEGFDPTADDQVATMLRSKFNIYLPQRTSIDKSLESTSSDHEIINLIIQYRTMSA
ncbi:MULTISPECIES: hypothetical protein [Marinomonas]|jgi:DNA polymerase I-like protein with 3'-5' exonuclease and polymerase domains|uniref:hypothetical protein n=1 Tax=Marinomonas TaxID=28253 RepID=UPI0010560936|nr:hypothetical protein [Marinomonas sp. KMM3893]